MRCSHCQRAKSLMKAENINTSFNKKHIGAYIGLLPSPRWDIVGHHCGRHRCGNCCLQDCHDDHIGQSGQTPDHLQVGHGGHLVLVCASLEVFLVGFW